MSTVYAQRVSFQPDNSTICRPGDGYPDKLEVDLNLYVEVAELLGELKRNDQVFPFGGPLPNVVKVGDRLYERKTAPAGAVCLSTYKPNQALALLIQGLAATD